MAKKKENTDNKEVLGENKENSAAKTADAGAENGVASAQEKFQIKLRELLALAKKKSQPKQNSWVWTLSMTLFMKWQKTKLVTAALSRVC